MRIAGKIKNIFLAGSVALVLTSSFSLAEEKYIVWKGGAPDSPSAWQLPENWQGNAVPKPDDKSEIVIPGEVEHFPVLTNNTRVAGKLRIKDSAVLTVKDALLEIDGGLFVDLGGSVNLVEGGEIWSDVLRSGSQILDTGLKLRSSFEATALLPNLRMSGGFLPDIWTFDVGPEQPADVVLINVAPYAEREVFPYSTMTHNFVDPDPDFRTMARSDRGAKVAAGRYRFSFEAPIPVAQVSWNSPYPRWALRADTVGDGKMDRILAMDLVGRVSNTGGVWVSRTTVSISFDPPEPVWSLELVDLGNNSQMYDFQILVPENRLASETGGVRRWLSRVGLSSKNMVTFDRPNPHEVMKGMYLDSGIPLAATGSVLEVAMPTPEHRLPRGFHIEPWMFALDQWIDKPKEERPPLTEYPQFVKFIGSLRDYHADTVNMWPPKKFNDKRGKGTYENPMLWPSEYDRHSIDENVLEQVADAFQAEGIRFMTMTRTAYAKPLEEFPETETSAKDAPYVSRHSREYLEGIVREQARSGVDGVGIGFDEQHWRALGNPRGADEATRTAFREETGMDVPENPEDSLAFRKWVLFAYEQFADYLAGAAQAAKSVNPDIITKSPVHLTLGTLWNDRVGVGIAEDIVARKAEIDYSRAYSYLSFSELGHYKTALAIKVSTGGLPGRKTVSLHNCPWAASPEKQSGFYLHFPPVHMLASPISAVMHGGGMPLYWRYNWIFRGGYDEQVRKSFSILDMLSGWGITEARVPKRIAVVRSRASEDWWQIRQRYNEDGDPVEQARGHLVFKVLLEALLKGGYPFDVIYLDHPDELEARLDEYDLLLLPFPYSVSRKAFDAIKNAVSDGKAVMLFGNLGETDEWGEPYETPLFDDLVASEKVVRIKEDLMRVGQQQAFYRSFYGQIDRLLGPNKPMYLNTYGNDVEVALLEKNEQEKFLALINWTDRQVNVDVGISLPEGNYRLRQAGTDGAREMRIAGQDVMDEKTLAKFRVEIAPWDVRVLNVYPNGK